MIATMKKDNQGHVLKITNTMSGIKAPILNPNHVIVTITALIGQQARTTRAPRSINQQDFGVRPTNPAHTTPKIAFVSNANMPNKITTKTSAVNLTPLNLRQPTFEPTPRYLRPAQLETPPWSTAPKRFPPFPRHTKLFLQ
uniref:Uncharacterized protein n=1 Tax=Romanomermis culicivorax TaxID=13658 RepID=A0A915I726_ROMCU